MSGGRGAGWGFQFSHTDFQLASWLPWVRMLALPGRRGNTEDSLAEGGCPHWGPLYLIPAEFHIGPVGSGLQPSMCKLQVHHLSPQVLLQAPNVSLQLGYLF